MKFLALCLGIILIILCPVFATDYYIDSTAGNDQNNGCCDPAAGYKECQGCGGTNGPWKTIAKINSFAGSPGFTDGTHIRFKRNLAYGDAIIGCTDPWGCSESNPLWVRFNTNGLTFEDYGTGEKPLIRRQYTAPISINDNTLKNLTIRNIDVSGQEWQKTASFHLWLRNIEGIVLDSIDGDGHKFGGITSQSEGKFVFKIDYPSGTVVIRNCNLKNWGPSPMPICDMGDVYAIEINKMTSGSFKIYNNTIHNINADAIQVRASTVPGEIYDNTWYNCGENAIDIKQSHNIDVHHNNFYRTPDFVGKGGIGGKCENGYWPLIAMIANVEVVGPYTSDNNRIHDNYLHDNTGSPAIQIGWMIEGHTCTGNRIYNNIIENTKYAGMYIALAAVDTEIYGNLISDSGSAGIFLDQPNTGNKIYKNTIYLKSNGGPQQGIKINDQYGVVQLSDNIIYMDNPHQDAFALHVPRVTPAPIVHHNDWFNNAKPVVVYWGTASYSSANWNNWISTHTGDINRDPLFLDPLKKVFSLRPDSPACSSGDKGEDMGAYPCKESVTYRCSDGLDNDGDGKKDFPTDPGCASLTDDDENDCGNMICESAESCSTCPADCGTCATLFQVGVIVEAEAGAIISPMAKGTDPSASGGSYIYTPTENQGSISYNFNVLTAGDYLIEARIIAPSVSKDSFFVGLDNENARGNDLYTWDTIESGTWATVMVNKRGNGNSTAAQFDPMVWQLSKGQHKFTFYGREAMTQLDHIMLKQNIACRQGETSPCDGCVTVAELTQYISRWKANEAGLTISHVMSAISEWRKGC